MPFTPSFLSVYRLLITILSLHVLHTIKIHALPLRALSSPDRPDLISILGNNSKPPELRTLTNIIWSCLATIFACTWTSVHPNIPAPREHWLGNVGRRLSTMFWGFIAPELVILWAVRQWFGARKIQRRFRDQGWTKTHGFFLQMGGLMLYDGDVVKGTLTLEWFEDLLDRQLIKFPSITEEEINDRSKGDGLSKGIVILQTSWFVTECIARASQKLAITELELITLAFAALNGVIYFFWWNKPLDVKCPVRVQMNERPILNPVISTPKVENTMGSTADVQVDHAQVAITFVEEVPREAESGHQDRQNETSLPSKASAIDSESLLDRNHGGEERDSSRSLDAHTFTSTSQQKVEYQDRFHQLSASFGPLSHHLPSFATLVHSRVEELLTANATDDTMDGRGLLRAPTFYALRMTEDETDATHLFSSFIGLVFGAVHCIGWDFSAPTPAERILWRALSLYITTYPVFMYFAFHSQWIFRGTTKPKGNGNSKTKHKFAWDIFFGVFHALASIGMLLFIPARLTLFLEAIVSLRSLPQASFETVQWTLFVPHL